MLTWHMINGQNYKLLMQGRLNMVTRININICRIFLLTLLQMLGGQYLTENYLLFSCYFLCISRTNFSDRYKGRYIQNKNDLGEVSVNQ